MKLSKIANRIIQIGISVVCIITIFLIADINQAKTNVVSIYDDRLIPIIQLTKISDNYNNDILHCLRRIGRNEITHEDACKLIDNAIIESNKYWSEYLKTYLTPEENQIAVKTKKNKQDLDNKLKQIEHIISSNKNKQDEFELQNLVENVNYSISRYFSEQLQSLIDIQKKEAKNLQLHTEQLYNKIFLFASVICLLCLCIIVLLNNRIKLQKTIIAKNKELENKNHELNRINNELDTTIEELRSSNEELYTSNENLIILNNKLNDAQNEIDVTVEELRTSNEELYTSNEDLNKTISQLDILKKELEERVISKTNELLKSQITFKSIFEFANDAIFIMVNDIITDCNEKTLEMFGCTKDTIIGHSPIEFSPEFQTNGKLSSIAGQNKINQALKGIPQRFDWKHIRYNNTEFDAEVSLNLIKRDDGSFLLAIIRDVTERINSAEILKRNESHLRTLINTIPDLIWLKNNEGEYLQCNQRFESLFGAKESDIIGKTDYDFVEKELADSFRYYDKKVIEKGLPSINEEEVTFFDGHKEILETIKTPIYNSNKAIIGVLGIGRNITERKKTEQELRLSEEKFAKAFRSSPDIIIITSLNDALIYEINDKTEQILGFTRDEVIGRSSFDFNVWVNLSQRDEYASHIRRVGFIHDFEVQMRKKTGEIIDTLLSGEFIEIQGEKYILGTIRDITDRKKIEKDLIKSERRLQNLLNTVTDYIYTVTFKNDNTIETRYGEGCISVTGYSVSEFEQDPNLWYRIILDNEKEFVMYKINQILQDKVSYPFEHRIIHKEGNIRWVRNTLVLKLDDQGDVISYDGLIQDITETKILQHQILNRVIETEEIERMHFSQELHDGIGPLLSATKMYVQLFDTPETSTNHEHILSKIKQLIEESSKTVREISFKLSPHILQNYGLLEALKAYSEKITESTTILFEFHFPELSRFNEKAETILYRVLCECINNTVKYAEASKITLDIHFENNVISMIYNDNGKGFDYSLYNQQKKGLGLLNMQSRINSINGIMNIISNEILGTTISFHFDAGILKSNS